MVTVTIDGKELSVEENFRGCPDSGYQDSHTLLPERCK